MNTATTQDWNDLLAEFLTELSQTQSELLEVLAAKRELMAKGELDQLDSLQTRETELSARLQACHDRRGELLSRAAEEGLPHDNLGELAKSLPTGNQEKLGEKMRDAAQRTRLLQHESLTNWVVAQRSLLHVSQMLEIIATGGRAKPTYGITGNAFNRGSLMDQEA